MQLTSTRKCVIVGAGICGLSTAVLLAESDPSMELEIWEASDEVGGLLAPVSFSGIECDKGSHRIHPQSDPLLLQLTQQQDWLQRTRCGTLLLNGKHIAYPPKPVGFLRGLGAQTALQMGLGFLTRPGSFQRFLLWEHDRTQNVQHDEGFEQFVIERVGHQAYEQFYRPYVEKVWGIEPREISRTVAKQRVSTSDPWETLLGVFKKKNTGQHFLYPRHGMAGLIQHLRQRAQRAGVQFRFGCKVNHHNIESIDATAVFFSGHLSHLQPQSTLKHRGLYLVYFAFPRGSVGTTDTFYAPGSEFWFGRVSQLERFSPTLSVGHRQLLCAEIPEGRWGPHQDFTQKVETLTRQLHDAKIVQPGTAALDVHQVFIPRVYPMYTRNWIQSWRSALEHVEGYQHVYPIGRQGLFLHSNIDHCVRIAQDAVQSFIRHSDAKHWLQHAEHYLDLRVRD